MVGQPGFSDMDDRLKRSSDPGDQLEACAEAFDFGIFRADIVKALAFTERRGFVSHVQHRLQHPPPGSARRRRHCLITGCIRPKLRKTARFGRKSCCHTDRTQRQTASRECRSKISSKIRIDRGPQLMSDEEWTFFERFLLGVRTPNGRKSTNHRLVLDGIFWIARTGAPWRDLPEEFGKWSSVYRQFRRWTLAELRGRIMDALNESMGVPDAFWMLDSTAVRAHHQAAGAKGGCLDRVSVVREVASRP